MDIIFETVIIIGTIIFALIFAYKNREQSKKNLTVSEVLFILVCVVAASLQALSAFNIINVSIKYTPIQIFAMMSIIYWAVFGLRKTPIFNKI